MTNKKQILNELGDTQKGKMALARYLTARLGHRENLRGEAERMLKLGRTHQANLRSDNPPSEKTIKAYSNMVKSLDTRTIKYGKGMKRAATALMTPILQENNSMTIKELNEKKLIQGIKNVIKGRPFKGGTRNVTSVPARPELNMGDALIRAKATEIMQDRKGPAGTSPYYYQNPNPKFGTIKEHYKEILNERIFNAANPLGKIETGVRNLFTTVNSQQKIDKKVAATKEWARFAGETREKLAKNTGGRVPSRQAVEQEMRSEIGRRKHERIYSGLLRGERVI